EFAQVNAFGHKKKMLDLWFNDQSNYLSSFSLLNNTSLRRDSFTNNYYSSFAWWFGAANPLVTWAQCDFTNNAFYSPSETALCFGRDEFESKFWFSQDSTIVYH